MKKTTQIILLLVAITLGSASSTFGAFPIKSANVATESTTMPTVAVSENQVTIANTTSTTKIAKSQKARGGKSKTLAAILAFFLGFYGVHSFYMGNSKKGLIQLILGLGGLILLYAGVIGAASSGTASIGILAIIGYIAALAAGIWALIDFVRILIGSLEPESGFNN